MKKDTFYQDHWRKIEDARLSRYEQMFVFREQQEPLITPLELTEGLTVADYGCGPGFMAMEFARRVGPSGRIYGFDINEQFISRAQNRAIEAGLDNLSFQQLDGLQITPATFDRVFCKNVLEYVPDVQVTLKEQFNMLKPGGRLQLIDSDWGFVIVEPWGNTATREFFDAAAPAFKEPNIGRKLYGHLREAGFADIRVQVSSSVDTVGGTMSVIRNMASYIETFDSLPATVVEQQIKQLELAIEEKQFLFILPQFLVTAVRPNL